MNLMAEIYSYTESLCDFRRELKVYEKVRFVPPKLNSYYYNLRARFIMRSFGKQLAAMLETSKNCQVSNDLTIYQIIPQDLHGTFFFKIMQNLMRCEVGQLLTKTKLKSLLFMTMNIEQSHEWAWRLNKELMKCYEQNPDQQLQVMMPRDESSDGSILETLCMKAAFDAEAIHDFSKDIQAKKEQDKAKMILEIQQKLSQFQEQVRLHEISLDKAHHQQLL
jgi:hypothetical protein